MVSVKHRKRLNLLGLAVLALASVVTLQAQETAAPPSAAAQPQSVDDKLAQSYHAMFDLKFEDAYKAADEAKALAQGDPMPFVAQSWAAFLHEIDRLHALRSEVFISDENFKGRDTYTWDAASKKIFDNGLEQAEKLANDRLGRDQSDIRALLALSLTNGLRANDVGVFGKKESKALQYIKAATEYAVRVLARAPDSYDAYVATGLGKYIIGRKSGTVRFFLRMGGYKGDEQEGMKELAMAAAHARYLAPFARILVAFEDLRKKNPLEARKKLELLHDQFPHNAMFLEELAKLGTTSAQLGRQGN